MYIERGIYDWRQTAAIVISNSRRKNTRIDDLNPFLQLKKDLASITTEQKKRCTSLADLARKLPGVKVIDKRN